MRGFEKISEKQFNIDVKDGNYMDIILPERKTKSSAGYDFHLIKDITLAPNQTMRIPLGVKVFMPENEYLGIYIRGSVGFKFNVRLCNQVGIIDSDYYNNPDNEGHMWIAIHNHGQEASKMKKGESIAQGIFATYNIASNDNVDNERTGGFGSTNKEVKNA